MSSPVIRSWGTYYGPGQATVLAVLDLTRTPFEKATEQTLDSVFKRTLYGTLDNDPRLSKRLVGRVFDHYQGLWVRPNSKSSSSSLAPHLLLGDRSVHVDKDRLATLGMSLIVEGPVRGKSPNLNPWARLGADAKLWRGLSTHLTATSLVEIGGSDSQVLRAGHGLAPEGVYVVSNNMLLQLAKELELPKPQPVEADKVFPHKYSALELRAIAGAAAI